MNGSFKLTIMILTISLPIHSHQDGAIASDAAQNAAEENVVKENAELVQERDLVARLRRDGDSEEWKGEKKRRTYDDGLALPVWAIVLITFSCVLFLICCCLCCCSIMQLQEEDRKRGYKNRRHSAKEFVIILVPGKRDQIYNDYEQRQAK